MGYHLTLTTFLTLYAVGWCSGPVAAECPVPHVTVDGTSAQLADLTVFERTQLAAAKIQCGVRYPRSPCLAEFRIKRKINHVSVLCREEANDE